MKKLLVLCCLFCLVGCSSEPEKKTVVCEADIQGVNQKITLEAEDDDLTVQKTESTLDFGSLGITEEQIKEVTKEFEDEYDLNGMRYTYSIEGTVLTEKIIVDYKMADLKELLDNGIIESEEENVTSVSLKQTVESLKEQGFTCNE